MTTKIRKYIPYSQLLSNKQMSMISGGAGRVYAHLRCKLIYTGRRDMVAINLDVAIRSRINPAELKACQAELMQAGILYVSTIQYTDNPGHPDRARYSLKLPEDLNELLGKRLYPAQAPLTPLTPDRLASESSCR